MVESQSVEEISSRYVRFAENEARGRSPLYEELALRVAKDRSVLEFLFELPFAKQQPNLLFAAVRHVCGTPRSWGHFHRLLASRPDEIREVMLKRRTQTNEPARCATLLPLLALLPQPLALLEVGASAGLCLIPDRYSYRYNGVKVVPSSNVGAVPPHFRVKRTLKRRYPKRMSRSRGEWALISNRSACMTMNRSRGSKPSFGLEKRTALLSCDKLWMEATYGTMLKRFSASRKTSPADLHWLLSSSTQHDTICTIEFRN
jgi:hypothetical protein